MYFSSWLSSSIIQRPHNIVIMNCILLSMWLFTSRDQKFSMDGRRDLGPHQDVGRRFRPAGAKNNAPDGKHLLCHLQQDVQSRFLQDGGAVPDEAEEGQIRLQAVLPEQVQTWANAKGIRKKQNFLQSSSPSLFPCAASEETNKFTASSTMSWDESWWTSSSQYRNWTKHWWKLWSGTITPALGETLVGIQADESEYLNHVRYWLFFTDIQCTNIPNFGYNYPLR